MKLLFITLALLLAAIYVGNVAMDDPGFVIIGYHGQVIRTSFIFFALVTILAGILLYYTVRFVAHLWATPRKVSEWNADRKEKKAQKSLSKGLAALAEGKWEEAERSLANDAQISNRLSHVHYLGAAKAAHKLGKVDVRDEYLQLASSSEAGSDIAVGLTRAELLLEHGQDNIARITLEELLEEHPNQPRVLKLLSKTYQKNKAWKLLQPLLKRLKKNKVLSEEEFDVLEKQTWEGLLKEASSDIATLKETWQTMPKKLKADPDFLFLYLEKLVHSSESNEALPLIEKALNKQWDDRLVALYGIAKGANPAKQLERGEKWLPEHQDDHTLLSVLGALCYRNELWGKAKHYLETAIEYGAGLEVYRQLADTLEKMGDPEAAAEVRKKGLEMATQRSQELVAVD